MIKQQNRFKGQAGIIQANRYGQSVRSSDITIRYLDKHNQTPSKFAVVVSKKVARLAVTRNRIRRKVFNVLEGLMPRIPNGYLFVISVYDEGIKSAKQKDLEEKIKELLKKQELYSNHRLGCYSSQVLCNY